MSKIVGMGANKKEKSAEAELKKEVKKLTAANKELRKENEELRLQVKELQNAAAVSAAE